MLFDDRTALLHSVQVECQAPKPILLDTGPVTVPYAWQPAITEISIFRAGQVPNSSCTMPLVVGLRRVRRGSTRRCQAVHFISIELKSAAMGLAGCLWCQLAVETQGSVRQMHRRTCPLSTLNERRPCFPAAASDSGGAG